MRRKKLESENLEVSLKNSITSDNLVLLTADVSELALDTILDNEVIQKIPFFGLLVKSGKVVSGIRKYFFAKKFITFYLRSKIYRQRKGKNLLKN